MFEKFKTYVLNRFPIVKSLTMMDRVCNIEINDDPLDWVVSRQTQESIYGIVVHEINRISKYYNIKMEAIWISNRDLVMLVSFVHVGKPLHQDV